MIDSDSFDANDLLYNLRKEEQFKKGRIGCNSFLTLLTLREGFDLDYLVDWLADEENSNSTNFYRNLVEEWVHDGTIVCIEDNVYKFSTDNHKVNRFL